MTRQRSQKKAHDPEDRDLDNWRLWYRYLKYCTWLRLFSSVLPWFHNSWRQGLFHSSESNFLPTRYFLLMVKAVFTRVYYIICRRIANYDLHSWVVRRVDWRPGNCGIPSSCCALNPRWGDSRMLTSRDCVSAPAYYLHHRHHLPEPPAMDEYDQLYGSDRGRKSS